jgi:hypothetical protein
MNLPFAQYRNINSRKIEGVTENSSPELVECGDVLASAKLGEAGLPLSKHGRACRAKVKRRRVRALPKINRTNPSAAAGRAA